MEEKLRLGIAVPCLKPEEGTEERVEVDKDRVKPKAAGPRPLKAGAEERGRDNICTETRARMEATLSIGVNKHQLNKQESGRWQPANTFSIIV